MSNPKYTNRDGQRFSGFVRAHLAVIEAEQVAGIPLEQILEDIKAQTDYKTMKLEGFKTALARARKWANENTVQAPAGATAFAATPAPGTPAAPVAAVVDGVVMATPTKASFSYQPAQAGQDMSHILGTPKKDAGKK